MSCGWGSDVEGEELGGGQVLKSVSETSCVLLYTQEEWLALQKWRGRRPRELGDHTSAHSTDSTNTMNHPIWDMCGGRGVESWFQPNN